MKFLEIAWSNNSIEIFKRLLNQMENIAILHISHMTFLHNMSVFQQLNSSWYMDNSSNMEKRQKSSVLSFQ